MKTKQSDQSSHDKALTTRWPLVNALNRVLKQADTVLNLICVSLIMFLMLFAAGEIIGRYFFNSPIPGHIEIVELIMVGVVFLGLAYTQLRNGHIRMQLLQRKIFRGRFYHMAEGLILLFSLVVFAVITSASFNVALDAYEFGDITSYINWPTWPSKMCIPLGSFLLCLRLSIQFVQQTYMSIWYQPSN